MGALIKCLVS